MINFEFPIFDNNLKLLFIQCRVEEIVQNVDLAPTFLDIAGVQVPPHMDGKSILPLIINRHRSIKYKWPDTFLIESSGRRETPEQLAEQRARAAAAKYSQMLSETNNKMELTLMKENRTFEELKHREHDLSSQEVEEDIEEDDDGDFDDTMDESDFDAELQSDEPHKSRRKRQREGKFFDHINYFKILIPLLQLILILTNIGHTMTMTYRHINRKLHVLM